LNAFDIFALPSVREGMSNTAVEAMATSLPVLLTNTGGNLELIVEGVDGMFFAPGDHATLSAKVESLARDPQLRERVCTAALHSVEAKFSLAEMLRNYRRLYQALASSQTSGARAGN